MFRKILAPLKDNTQNYPPSPLSPGSKQRRRDLRGKENMTGPTTPSVHVSEPSDFKLVAHVECDPNTGLYTGIEEFMTLATLPRGRKSPVKLPPVSDLGLSVSSSSRPPRSPRASSSPVPLRSATVSKPFRTRHEVHVRLDPSNPTGFAGLPLAWENILKVSGILRDEAMANPEAVIDVLNFSKTTDAGVHAPLPPVPLPPICLDRIPRPSFSSFDDITDADTGPNSDSLPSHTSSSQFSLAHLPAPPEMPERPSSPVLHLSHTRSDSTQMEMSPSMQSITPGRPTTPSRSDSLIRERTPTQPTKTPSPTPSPQSNGTIVVNASSPDYMEAFIGAERKTVLPDAIPEYVDPIFRRDDPYSLFTRLERIGEGSCGAVFRAVDRQSRFVALKRVTPENDRDWKLYKFEVAVMQEQTDAANLVDCYDAFRHGADLWIVMEYMSAGTLAKLLDGRRMTAARDMKSGRQARMEERVIAFICREVLRGLLSLHAIRRVHRDIKGDNVLLDMDGSVKVADFGFCAELSKRLGKRNTVVGTPFWMAPEVVRGANYDCKVDIWSTGILALECAMGRPPHHGVSPIRAMFLIATQGAPALPDGQGFSDEMRDFVGRCCALKAADRPTAQEALEHAFIGHACDQAEAAAMFNEACEQRLRTRKSSK